MICRDDELYTYRMYYPSRVKTGEIHTWLHALHSRPSLGSLPDVL
jgi:hypothetical protein